jgi:hypothetical protein
MDAIARSRCDERSGRDRADVSFTRASARPLPGLTDLIQAKLFENESPVTFEGANIVFHNPEDSFRVLPLVC